MVNYYAGDWLDRNRCHVTDNITRQDSVRGASLQQSTRVPTAAPMPMHSPASEVQASQRNATQLRVSHNLEGPRDVNASSNGVLGSPC